MRSAAPVQPVQRPSRGALAVVVEVGDRAVGGDGQPGLHAVRRGRVREPDVPHVSVVGASYTPVRKEQCDRLVVLVHDPTDAIDDVQEVAVLDHVTVRPNFDGVPVALPLRGWAA